MSKLLISLMFLAVSLGSAQAISRYDSTRLSCARIHSIINSQGAAIMRYPSTRVPGLVLYDRYVRNGAQCMVGEAAVLSYIPAADTKRCPVYSCASYNLEDNFPFSGGRHR